MTKHLSRKLLSVLLVVLLAVAALSGCTDRPTAPDASDPPISAIPEDGSTLGEGAHTFTFQVVMKDETTYTYTVNTDAENVGDALLENGLIAGEKGEYGLFVTAVLGTTLDYTADGYWWALSEDGVDSMVAADALAIQDGSTYAFTATPAE